MSAGRIIDDHLELANIGTKTHAQIDTHIADPSAHHAKYTNAEAVNALATADVYVKNTSDTIVGCLKIEQTSHLDSISLQGFDTQSAKNCSFFINQWGSASIDSNGNLFFSSSTGYVFFKAKEGTHFNIGENFTLNFRNHDSTNLIEIEESTGKLNLLNHQIKNPKNHVASALSGTKKLVEIDIAGVPYYYEVYPTKA